MLKQRKVRPLGELVIATGADASDMEMSAGALLDLRDHTDATQAESRRKRGAAFLQERAQDTAHGAGGDDLGAAPDNSGAATA